MIEQTLERIADALERMASAQEAANGGALANVKSVAVEPVPAETAKPVKAKAAKKEVVESKPVEAKEITLADVSNGLRDLITAKGAQTAKEILAKFKANRISEIDPVSYPAFIEAVNTAKSAK